MRLYSLAVGRNAYFLEQVAGDANLVSLGGEV